MVDTQIMTHTLDQMLVLFSDAHGRLFEPALWFLKYFLTFETVAIGFLIMLDKVDIGFIAIKHLVLTGIIIFFITEWPMWQAMLRDSMVYLGLKASGSQYQIIDVFDPSALTMKGINLVKPMTEWARSLSFKGALENLFTILITMVTVLTVILSFFWMAVQVFVTLIEFYFSSMCFGFLMTFRIFSPLKWIAQGAIQNPVQHGAKLFTMAFVIGIADPFFADLQELVDQGSPTFEGACMLALGALAFMMMVLRLGGLAGSLLSGTPSLSGGDLAKAGAIAGVATAGTAAAGAGITKMGLSSANMGGQMLNKAANAGAAMSSGALTGGQLGSMGAQSMLGKAGGAVVGGIRGGLNASPVAQYSRQAMDKMKSNFSNSIQQGRVAGWQGTGGEVTSGMRNSMSNQAASNVGQSMSSGFASSQFQAGVKAAYQGSRAMGRVATSVHDDHSSFSGSGKPKN